MEFDSVPGSFACTHTHAIELFEDCVILVIKRIPATKLAEYQNRPK